MNSFPSREKGGATFSEGVASFLEGHVQFGFVAVALLSQNRVQNKVGVDGVRVTMEVSKS